MKDTVIGITFGAHVFISFFCSDSGPLTATHPRGYYYFFGSAVGSAVELFATLLRSPTKHIEVRV